MDKFINPKTKKEVLKIDDEGNEVKDEQYFKDLAKKKKLEEKEESEDEDSTN